MVIWLIATRRASAIMYERHEVAAFLDSDAELLRQHLGDEKRHLAVVNT